MGTPIYTAGAGSKVRFRVLNPGGTNDVWLTALACRPTFTRVHEVVGKRLVPSKLLRCSGIGDQNHIVFLPGC